MKVEKVKGQRSEVKGEPRKPKMTAEQKAALEAVKSFDADVERAGYIQSISSCVLRERCDSCTNKNDCNGGSLVCRMVAVASVAVGMIEEGGAK